MRDVLAGQLMSLYRANASGDWHWFEQTATYENGKLIKTQGRLKEKELNDVYITQEIVSQVANAKAAGLSDFTVVFNSSDKAAPLRHLEKEKELVQELKPILQKYTKQ